MTVPFDPAQAIVAVEAARDTYSSEPDAYIDAAKKLLGAGTPGPDDIKEAAKLALDAAKLFITIGLAGIATVGGFVQFAVNRGAALSDDPILAFGAAAFFALVSIGCGFMAVATLTKQADGRSPVPPGEQLWASAGMRQWINGQAGAGLLAIMAFALAIGLLASKPTDPPVAVTITVPAGSPTLKTLGGPLTIEGQWSSLTVGSPGGPTVELPAVAQGASSRFTIDWK